MTFLPVTVRYAAPDEWPVIRRLRLRALTDAPLAFAADRSREAGWVATQWLSLFERSLWVVTSVGGDDVGVLRSVRDTGEPGIRHLESVWVEPRFRCRGVARTLVTAVAERERCEGVTELFVWVLDGNDGARRAYERIGFVPTGERQLLAGTDRFESRLWLSVEERLRR